MDMSLSKLQEMVKDREAWRAAVMGSQRVGHNWTTEQKQYNPFGFWGALLLAFCTFFYPFPLILFVP